MTKKLGTLAILAALAAGASSVAQAQNYTYTCPAGYVLQGTTCQPTPAAVPGAVVGGAVNATGTVVGGAVNTAGTIAGSAVNTAGNIAGGALNAAGNIVGGTLNAAGHVVGGTVGAVTNPPATYGSSTPPAVVATCAPGYMLYQGACYPAH